jgi:hypothetical protein
VFSAVSPAPIPDDPPAQNALVEAGFVFPVFSAGSTLKIALDALYDRQAATARKEP